MSKRGKIYWIIAAVIFVVVSVICMILISCERGQESKQWQIQDWKTSYYTEYIGDRDACFVRDTCHGPDWRIYTLKPQGTEYKLIGPNGIVDTYQLMPLDNHTILLTSFHSITKLHTKFPLEKVRYDTLLLVEEGHINDIKLCE